ncbi:MAG: aldo/keto reductase [Terriglobia bacterium]|jgi:predicted aldo/keto reductase-like oxidoreductase
MKSNSSRRDFLYAGLALPVAGLASTAGFGKATVQSSPPPSLASTPKLTYRTIGKTGLKVTAVGFGCMVTSDASVIERASDVGINYFDTARGYQHGNNERMVGAALKKKRKDLVLSSKSGGRTKDSALSDLDTSLRELGTDYIDIWYVHGRDKTSDVPDELFEAQQIAKQQGKIRFAGLSTHNAKDMIPFLVKKGALDVVLVTYNFTMDKSMDALIEQASNAGLGVVTMKVMAGGFRAGNPRRAFYPQLTKDGALLAALKWVLKNPKVNTTIPSMTDMDQLEENLRAMAEPYSQVEEKLLAQRLEQIGPLYCRMCNECEGTCAQRLPVANLLRYLTYAEGYGQFSLGREHFLALPAEVTSVRCQDCVSCTVTCPFGVKVSSRLARAQELFA